MWKYTRVNKSVYLVPTKCLIKRSQKKTWSIWTNLQTSLAFENIELRMTSGAIQGYVPAVLIFVVWFISRANPKSVIFSTLRKRFSSTWLMRTEKKTVKRFWKKNFKEIKNVKNTYREVLLLTKCYVTKSNTPPWVFFMFFKLYKWSQVKQSTIIMCFWQQMIKLFSQNLWSRTWAINYHSTGSKLNITWWHRAWFSLWCFQPRYYRYRLSNIGVGDPFHWQAP